MYGRSVSLPASCRRFGDEAGELAGDLRVRRDVRHRRGPWRERAVADARLRAVVDDDAQVRMPLEHAREPRQVPRQHQRIEDEAVRDHRVERRAKRRTSSQSSSASSCTIGRSPTSLASSASARDAVRAHRGAANGAQPTTPATNGVAAGELEQEARLGDRRRRLDENRGVDAVAREDGREIGGPEIAVDRAERGREPTVVAARDPPEVLVRVDRSACGPDRVRMHSAGSRWSPPDSACAVMAFTLTCRR